MGRCTPPLFSISRSLLKTCSNLDEFKADPTPRKPGNQFLRVSTRLGVGFSGEWYFQTRSHGFAGALVVEQVGVGVVATAEQSQMMRDMKGATVGPITLAVGTYVVSYYAAYDEAGGIAAAEARSMLDEKSNRGKVFTDTILFMQHSHCKAYGYEPLDAWRLEKCGGNEDKPEDQVGVGGPRSPASPPNQPTNQPTDGLLFITQRKTALDVLIYIWGRTI